MTDTFYLRLGSVTDGGRVNVNSRDLLDVTRPMPIIRPEKCFFKGLKGWSY